MLHSNTYLSKPGFLKESKVLIKVRLWLYSLAFIHIVAVAFVLLRIDFNSFDDPDVRMYEKIKFKLITAWFNLFTMAYYPMCIYCEWRALREDYGRTDVKLLNQLRYLCFTSILLPATAFGDILFWRMWYTHQELIAPLSVHKVVPFWCQHCMHTVSLVTVLLDLILVKRNRPKNYALSLTILSCFLTTYIMMCLQSCLKGEYIYPGLKNFKGFKFLVLVIYVYIENLFYFTSQWLVVDFVWGQRNVKKLA